MKKIIPLLVGLFLFTNCATTPYKIGREFDIGKITDLKIGVTTEKEVLLYFGEPYRKGLHNGSKVYTYVNENLFIESDKEVRKEGNTLVIEFDKNGFVKNYYLNYPGKEVAVLNLLYFNYKQDKDEDKAEELNQQNQNLLQQNL